MRELKPRINDLSHNAPYTKEQWRRLHTGDPFPAAITPSWSLLNHHLSNPVISAFSMFSYSGAERGTGQGKGRFFSSVPHPLRLFLRACPVICPFSPIRSLVKRNSRIFPQKCERHHALLDLSTSQSLSHYSCKKFRTDDYQEWAKKTS